MAAAAVAVCFGLVVSQGLAAPADASTPTFPSWDQVEHAKLKADQARDEYTRIAADVSYLQRQVEVASAAQLKAEFAYSEAQAALQTATATATRLSAEAASAATQSAEANQMYGAFVSQLYLTGGTNVTAQLLLSHDAGSNLLDELGTMSQLTEHSAGLHTLAVQKSNLSASLSAQSTVAEAARAKLASAAQQKLKLAQAAAQKVQSALNRQQHESGVLYQMAGVLKKTAASTQKKYFDGVAYRAAIARQQAAQAAASASSGGSSALYSIALGITPNVAAAQAYAASQMGAHGWDGSQFQCLLQLWTIESGWRVNAYNTSSGAYGIPQAWPASKMAVYGSDWMTSYATQINWGLAYIQQSYSTPCGALSFETSHVPYWY